MRKALILIGLIVGLVAPITSTYAQTAETVTLTVEQQAQAAIEAALPEGVTMQNATAGQLNRALKKVARENPKDPAAVKAATNVVVGTGKVSPERATSTVTREAMRSLVRSQYFGKPKPTATASAPEIDVIIDVVRELLETQAENSNEQEIGNLVTRALRTAIASGASDDELEEIANGLGNVLVNNPDTAGFASNIIDQIEDETGTPVVITSPSGTTATASLL